MLGSREPPIHRHPRIQQLGTLTVQIALNIKFITHVNRLAPRRPKHVHSIQIRIAIDLSPIFVTSTVRQGTKNIVVRHRQQLRSASAIQRNLLAIFRQKAEQFGRMFPATRIVKRRRILNVDPLHRQASACRLHTLMPSLFARLLGRNQDHMVRLLHQDRNDVGLRLFADQTNVYVTH